MHKNSECCIKKTQIYVVYSLFLFVNQERLNVGIIRPLWDFFLKKKKKRPYKFNMIIFGLDTQTYCYYLNLNHFSLLARTSSKSSDVQLLLVPASSSVANNKTSEGEGGTCKVKTRLCGFHFNLSPLFLITGNYNLALVQRQTVRDLKLMQALQDSQE